MVTRPNILALQAWGRRPKSARRRRRALAALYAKPTGYIAMLAVVGLVFVIYYINRPQNIAKQNIDRGLLVTEFLVSWWLGVFVSAMAPFRIGDRSGNARALQSNGHDYYLAGIKGGDVLTGLAAPQLAGIRLFAWTFLAVVWLLFLTVEATENVGKMFELFFMLSFAAAMFNLLAGTRFALALWALYPGRGQRMLLTAAMVFSSPMTIVSLCPPLIYTGLFMGNFSPLFVSEAVLLIIRFVVCLAMWARAVTTLDGRNR